MDVADLIVTDANYWIGEFEVNKGCFRPTVP
jgi:hypothetical protein